MYIAFDTRSLYIALLIKVRLLILGHFMVYGNFICKDERGEREGEERGR